MKKPLIAITGASSGIGAAIAREFAGSGHPLLLMARRLDRLQALNLEQTICCKVDVTKVGEIENAVAEAEQEFGPVDCMINCAGMMLLGRGDVQEPSEWKEMIDVNVLGVLNGMRSVLPGMINRKGGTIINLSSIAGRKTFTNHAAYCGTKFAVHAVTESIREEVCEHNVRVLTLAPGVVETELLGHTTSQQIVEDYEEWKKTMGSILSPEDVARIAAFMYGQPQSVSIREVDVATTRQGP